MTENFEKQNLHESENETTERPLTEEEKNLLEGGRGKIRVLVDKPQILYCAGKISPLYHIKTTEGLEAVRDMVETDKVVLFVQEGLEEKNLPTLNEAIDMVLKRKGLIEDMLDKFGHLKTDRSVMEKIQSPVKAERDNVPKEEAELAESLSHYNGYSFCNAFSPKRNDYEIRTFAPPKFSEQFSMRLALEVCSAHWLEPYGRSGYSYDQSHDQSHLDSENHLIIFEDPEVVKKAIETEAHFPSPSDFLQTTIDEHFGGDIAAFQKRWGEYYQNWWPDEFRAMQKEIEKMKEWLRAQKE